MISLRDLIAATAPHFELEVIAAPNGIEVPVSRAEICIEDCASLPESSSILLAVSMEFHGLAQLAEAASEAGATAIIMRIPNAERERLAELGQVHQVAILSIQDASWGSVFTRINELTQQWILGDERMVRGNDLFALVDAAAGLIGGHVMVNDRDLRVLAYSSGNEPVDEIRHRSILARVTPADVADQLQADGIMREVWASDVPIRVEKLGARPRIISSIRNGFEVLGSIAVIEGDTPFTNVNLHALEETSQALAVHLLHLRNAESHERRLGSNTLRSLLNGDAGAAQGIGRQFGSGPFEVVAFRILEPGTQGVPHRDIRQHRLEEFISLRIRNSPEAFGLVSVGNTTYLLCASTPNSTLSLALASSIPTDAMRTQKLSVIAAVGSVAHGRHEIQRSRSEAELVLEILAHGNTKQFASYSEVWPYAFVERIRESAASDILDIGPLGAVFTSDSETGTQYVTTLRAYLDHGADIASAARFLNVHPNTVRYRMQRLPELFGLDISEPMQRLVTHLQLILLQPLHSL